MKKVKIVLILILVLACNNKRKGITKISEDSYVKYSIRGNNILVYHSNFNVGEGNILHSEGLEFAVNNDLLNAEKKFTKALSVNSEHPVILNNLGNLAYEKKNIKKAIAFFKRAIISSDSTYHLAFLNLGKSYGLVGEQEAAEKYYKYVILNSDIDLLTGLSHFGMSKMYLDYGYIEMSQASLNFAKKKLANFSDLDKILEKRELKLKHYYD